MYTQYRSGEEFPPESKRESTEATSIVGANEKAAFPTIGGFSLVGKKGFKRLFNNPGEDKAEKLNINHPWNISSPRSDREARDHAAGNFLDSLTGLKAHSSIYCSP